jgi:hypothetical protein
MPQSIRRSFARVRAIRLDAPSIGEAGLAFILAYVAAYIFSAL